MKGHLRIKANEYGYKEKDRKLKEQFIDGINDNDMMTEIIRELTAIKKTNEIPVTKYSMGQKGRGTKGPKSAN